MPSTKLFGNWTWRRNLPEPFHTLTVKKQNSVYSRYNTMTNKESTLHAPTLSAVLAYMNLSEKGAVGKKDNMIITEYPSRRNETHICIYDRNTGKFTAGVYQNALSSPVIYEMKSTGSGQSGAALFFALICAACQDEEFQREYANLVNCKTNGYRDMETTVRSAAVLCDNLYRRIENAANLGDDGIATDIPSTGNIPLLNQLKLNRGDYSPAEVIGGTFEILKPSAAKKPDRSTASVDKSDFEGKYVLSGRVFTEKEKEMIPKLEDWYIIPPEVVTLCRHAKMTTESTVKMRNFMFRGNAGTGKTEGAKAVAAGLGLPYVYITCSANTEIIDLLGQILPDVKTDFGEPALSGSYPTFEDIRMDPSTAYCTLTGEYNETVTENDVYMKLLETIRKEAANQSGSEQGFRYVDTALVDAIRYGYVCEIQEPSIIANPGVLVGLNALLDNCRSVTLPTGEVISRHPDTVIIVTTNSDYNGCKEMNQSVISRMQLIFDVDEPDTDTIIERVMKITKCGDKSAVRRMAETVREISEKCRETMISDGCCGVRELIAWVQSYMITDNILESSKYTVLPSVSNSKENRAEIYSTCFEPKYAA